MEVYVVMIGTAWEGLHTVAGIYRDRAKAEEHVREIDEAKGDSFGEVQEVWME